jgi:hypothetical protein
VQAFKKLAQVHFAPMRSFSFVRCFASRDFVYKILDFSSTVRDFSLDTEAQESGVELFLFAMTRAFMPQLAALRQKVCHSLG